MPVSILPVEPNQDGTCRVCRGELHPESWLCLRCGAAHGERNRCPHCRTIARTLPHPTLVNRCSVCGKPRILPGPHLLAMASESTADLLLAGQSHRIGAVVKYLGYAMLAVGLPGLLLTIVVLLILTPGAWVSGIAGFFAVLPLLFWLFLSRRSNAAQKTSTMALDRAYSTAILELLRKDGTERDADAIARLLGLPLARTETLLARLNANDRMTSRVTDDGNLLYGATGAAVAAEPGRLRIAPASGEPGSNSTDPASQSIIDAELDGSTESNGHFRHRT
jgi:hypothetical protein